MNAQTHVLCCAAATEQRILHRRGVTGFGSCGVGETVIAEGPPVVKSGNRSNVVVVNKCAKFLEMLSVG